jgi:sarcosine oxidase subunit gamma
MIQKESAKMSNQTQSPYLQSPLVQLDLDQIRVSADVLSVTEQAYCGHINLRGSTDNSEFMQAAQSVLGLALPVEFNRFVQQGDLKAVWCGPNEWLLITAPGQETAIVSDLKASLENVYSAVTDITGGNTILQISGSKARDLLAKGCPIDLHQSVFGVGHCAQTVLAKAGMTILQVDQAPIFTVVIRRSFSDYLGTWLIDAAREFSE